MVGCTLLRLALPVMGSVRLEQNYLVLVFGACGAFDAFDACGANQNTNTTLVHLANFFHFDFVALVCVVHAHQFDRAIRPHVSGCQPAGLAARLL